MIPRALAHVIYIAQVRQGALEVVESLGAIDPDESPVEAGSLARA